MNKPINCSDLLLEINMKKFENIVEDHAITVFAIIGQTSTPNITNYLEAEIKKFQEKHKGINFLNNHTTLINIDEIFSHQNIKKYDSSFMKIREEIIMNFGEAFKKYKILTRNLKKKNFQQIIDAKNKFFNKNSAVKAALTKTYETFYLYQMVFLELEIYTTLLHKLDTMVEPLVS